MNFCMNCGEPILYLEHGAYDGQGRLAGCKKCKSIFRQTSVGIRPSWQKEPYNLDQYYAQKQNSMESLVN